MAPPSSSPTKRNRDDAEGAEGSSKRQRRSRWVDDDDRPNGVTQTTPKSVETAAPPTTKGDLSEIVKRLSSVVKEKGSVTHAVTTTPPTNDAAATAAARARALAQASVLAMGLQVNQPSTVDLAKRVYIGNLYYELKEDDIRNHFSPLGTIRSVDLTMEPGTNRSKGFCFIEYEDVLAAESAVQVLNGSQLANRSLKVGRPTRGNSADTVSAQSIGQEAIKSVPTKCIYIGCVRAELNSAHLQSIFSPFGEISKCVMAPFSLVEPAPHRGYGFIEFADEASASNAIIHMNGFELAGQKLRVGKASPSAIPINLSISQDKIVANAATNTSLPMRSASAAVPVTADAHRCLCLVNMVDKGEVDDELAGEVEEECSRFGKVERVEVHELASEVRVFVVFSDGLGASKAKKAMNGRFFGGKQVRAGLYPLTDLVSRQFESALV